MTTQVLFIHKSEVSQTDLENILTVRAQIDRYQRLLERIESTALKRISEGAPVEAGRRSYEIEEFFDGGILKRRLLVQ